MSVALPGESYLVVDSVEVGMETLAEPPACVADLRADVPGVGGAEHLVVMVPAKRIRHGAAEPGHVQAVPLPFPVNTVIHHHYIYIYIS